MLDKIIKALNNPLWFAEAVLRRIRAVSLKKIIKDGKVYFKYRGELYPEYLNKGNAMSFIEEKAEKYCIGLGIDIGAGEWPLKGAIPVYEAGKDNAYRLDSFEDGSLDYVFSSHCLEHLERWKDALSLWIRKIKPGGILFLYLPHKSMALWRPGAPWVGKDHKWSPSVEVLKLFLVKNKMELLDFESGRDSYWSLHIAAGKFG